MTISTRMKAVLALVLTGILGGVAPLFMKIALKEFGPFQILFIRFGIASILIIPILISVLKNITLQQLKHGIITGLLFTPLFVSLAQYFPLVPVP